MSLVQGRGGIPHVWRKTITTTGRLHKIPFNIRYLQIRADGYECQLYFLEDDFDKGVNYVRVPVASPKTSDTGWAGPVELYIHNTIWLKAVGGNSNVELVAYQRRA